MSGKELLAMLEAVGGIKSLRDINVCFENGRDGKSDLTPIRAAFKNTGVQHDPQVTLVFTRENK